MLARFAKYAHQGMEVTLICATRGEAGEISDPALAAPETLGVVRQRGLEAAAEIIGIKHVRFLDRRDSGMAGSPENEDSRALVQSTPEEIIGKLVGLMRLLKPDVVVTFEPFGWYGHPDHQVMSTWATAAYGLVNNTKAYPDQGMPYQPQRLFYTVIPFSGFRAMLKEAIVAGYIEDDGISAEVPNGAQLGTEAAVTHIIDVRSHFATKRQAMAAHRTQFSPDHMFSKLPSEIMIKASGKEHFIQIVPIPDASLRQNRLDNIFADLF